MSSSKDRKRIRLERRSPFYWRVTFDHPPLNIFGPESIPAGGNTARVYNVCAHHRNYLPATAASRKDRRGAKPRSPSIVH